LSPQRRACLANEFRQLNFETVFFCGPHFEEDVITSIPDKSWPAYREFLVCAKKPLPVDSSITLLNKSIFPTQITLRDYCKKALEELLEAKTKVVEYETCVKAEEERFDAELQRKLQTIATTDTKDAVAIVRAIEKQYWKTTTDLKVQFKPEQYNAVIQRQSYPEELDAAFKEDVIAVAQMEVSFAERLYRATLLVGGHAASSAIALSPSEPEPLPFEPPNKYDTVATANLEWRAGLPTQSGT